MKAIIVTIITATLAAVAAPAPTPAPPSEIAFALSPFQPASDRTNQEALLQRFLLRDRPQSCRVTIWDAYGLKVLCDLPAAPLAFDSPAARAPRLVPALTALRQWATSVAVPGAPAGLENSRAIKVTEWIEAVALRPASGNRVLVICASPFQFVPHEPSFSMVQARYPSDGCLARPSAENIYGTADKHGHLANTTVLWAYASEDIWASDRHKERISRFWSMFIASQGPNALLARFTSDTPQVLLEALRTDHHLLGEFAINPSDSALVMHVATVRDIPVEVPLPVPPSPPKPIAQPTPVVLPVPATTPVVAPQATTPPPARVVKVVQVIPPILPPPALVTLDVRVTDTANHPVAGLGQPDFIILEDGVRQDIASFSTERAPMSLVLLIDTSGSIASKLEKIRAAASTIIRQAGAKDEFCLIEFKAEVSVIQDFTSDPSSADRALSALKAGGETALLDAVRFGIEHANQHGRHERKGLVLITDGGENGSHSTRAEVIPLLQQGNVQFYSVAFPEGLGPAQMPDSRGHAPVKVEPTEALARNLLDTLAKASSGGLLFYPRQAAELPRISESIASDLRTPRYTLAYRSRRPQTEAGWRSVQVQVRPSPEHGQLTARTRAGYVAGQANATPGTISSAAVAAQPTP